MPSVVSLKRLVDLLREIGSLLTGGALPLDGGGLGGGDSAAVPPSKTKGIRVLFELRTRYFIFVSELANWLKSRTLA